MGSGMNGPRSGVRPTSPLPPQTTPSIANVDATPPGVLGMPRFGAGPGFSLRKRHLPAGVRLGHRAPSRARRRPVSPGVGSGTAPGAGRKIWGPGVKFFVPARDARIVFFGALLSAPRSRISLGLRTAFTTTAAVIRIRARMAFLHAPPPLFPFLSLLLCDCPSPKKLLPSIHLSHLHIHPLLSLFSLKQSPQPRPCTLFFLSHAQEALRGLARTPKPLSFSTCLLPS